MFIGYLCFEHLEVAHWMVGPRWLMSLVVFDVIF